MKYEKLAYALVCALHGKKSVLSMIFHSAEKENQHEFQRGL